MTTVATCSLRILLPSGHQGEGKAPLERALDSIALVGVGVAIQSGYGGFGYSCKDVAECCNVQNAKMKSLT